MPQFRYTATNAQGKTVRGMADAPSEEALYTKLRDDGLYMSEALQTKRVRSTFRPLKTAVLADFCRNLGTLLTAGVPLVRASASWRMSAASARSSAPCTRPCWASWRKGIPLSGSRWSPAAPAFPNLLLAMIRSAEAPAASTTPAPDATYYEREHKMNQQVGNSMMYPLILCVLIVAVIAILMTFVLPQFKPMFDQMEKLPFLTQLLFDASDFVGANWPLLLVALALIFFGFKLLLAQPRIRRQWDRFILHAPVVGVLNRKICTARFASTLSNLYGSGVPIITTLGAARDRSATAGSKVSSARRWTASAPVTACRSPSPRSTALRSSWPPPSPSARRPASWTACWPRSVRRSTTRPRWPPSALSPCWSL